MRQSTSSNKLKSNYTSRLPGSAPQRASTPVTAIVTSGKETHQPLMKGNLYSLLIWLCSITRRFSYARRTHQLLQYPVENNCTNIALLHIYEVRLSLPLYMFFDATLYTVCWLTSPNLSNSQRIFVTIYTFTTFIYVLEYITGQT